MESPADQRISPPREVSLLGPYRYTATPIVWQRNADGTGHDVPFLPCFGATPEEAVAKAQQVLDNWRKEPIGTGL